MLAVVVVILTWGSELLGVRPLDRDVLLAALQQRAATGVPRHLDHDEGEQLQAAVTAALTADPNDGDLAWAATRASFALSPHVNPPITDGAPPAAWIDVHPTLSLPWRAKAAGTIDVSLDGSSWRHAAEIQQGSTDISIPIARIFRKDASRPGFHVVRFRAALRFSGVPAGMPSVETRDLPSRTYGVVGATAGGMRAATILNSGARASASSFDTQLPDEPVDTWLRSQVPSSEPGGPHVVWTSRWCDSRTDADASTTASVCALAMVPSASPSGGHAEIWIKIASVDLSGQKPTWNAATPSLEAAELIRLPVRTTVRLPDVPFTLHGEQDAWPKMSVVLDADDIALLPASPRPGEPVRVRVRVRNTGKADVHGMTIDMLAFDTPERVLLQRRFVRTIAAGESAVIELDAAFPLGYGGIVVSAMPLSDDLVLGVPEAADGSSGFSHAARLVHPELAPRGYVERVRASVGCKPGCTNVR